MQVMLSTDELLELFANVAVGVRRALDGVDDWHALGDRAGQYGIDLTADDVALTMLDDAGVGVLSEESGLRRGDAEIVVVLDPVDGSTNASRGIPWFATSLCAVDVHGPFVALVENQANGTRYTAVRGRGAWRNGVAISPSTQTELKKSIVGLSGLPPRWLGWKQFRALGAAALDLCAVADGTLDAYIDASPSAHGSWDYLGGLLVCQEAGAVVADAQGRELVVLEHEARRTPVAAATQPLLDAALAQRSSF
jgi:myo-inositol-1(or 4)-monophosphatase